MINKIERIDDLQNEKIYDWFDLLAEDGEVNDMITKTIVKMYLFGYEVMEWN